MDSRQLNILLVSNNNQEDARTRDLLAKIDGWSVNMDAVTIYEAALEKIKEQPYDVCLLNGQQHGLKFLHQAMANGLTTPLIFLTESADPQVTTEAMNAGAIDYLVKSEINAPLLERSIRYAMRYKQLTETVASNVQERLAELSAVNEKLREKVADYQQKEQKLLESEKQYRQLFNIDIYGVEVLDEQGKITACNPTYEEMLGYSREQIVGQLAIDFVSDRAKKMFEKKMSTLAEEGQFDGEIELARQDDSVIMVWKRARAIYNPMGVFTGSVSYNRDITERLKAIRQISTLARALEQNPHAIMVIDNAAKIQYVNFKFTELTGFSYDETIGQTFHSFKSDQLSLQDYKELWDAINAGEEWHQEILSFKKDEDEYWESITVAPMVNSKGTITHFIISREDITYRKQEETEVIQTQRRVGDLMTGHIGDLTTLNEDLQREIAERKRVEIELRRSRARLKAQYKGIPVQTYSWQIVGNDMALVDYNDAAEKSSQGKIMDTLGKKASEVFKDRPQVLSDFARCATEKTIVKRDAPYRMVTTGETKHWVTTYNFVPPNLILVHIEDVTEHKLVEADLKETRSQLEKLTNEYDDSLSKIKESLIREMTKREQLEQALQESQRRLQEVTKNIDERLKEQYRGIPIPTYSWQKIANNFVLIDFNDAAAAAMGRIVDFLGKPASKVFEDRQQVLEDFERCFRYKMKVTREAPYRMVTTGETKYWVTTYNYIHPNLVIVHIQDSTSYRQAEAELKRCRKQLEEVLAKSPTNSGESNETIQREITKRQRLEQLLQQADIKLRKYQEKFEETVKEQTATLTKMVEQLQQQVAQREGGDISLRENRARLKAQYKGIPIATYSWQRVGEDFVLVDYNDAAEKATKGRIVDLMGKATHTIFKDRPEILTDFSRCFSETTTVRRELLFPVSVAGESKVYMVTYNFVPPNMVILYLENVSHK